MPDVWIMENVPGLSTFKPMTPVDAVETALGAQGWERMVVDLPSGVTPPLYWNPSFAVLPRWERASAEEFGMLFGMIGTVVEFEDDEYASFITRIESRSFGGPAPRANDE